MTVLRIARDALAGIQERERQLAQRELGMLMEEPHRLRGVQDGPPTDRDDQVLAAGARLDTGGQRAGQGADRRMDDPAQMRVVEVQAVAQDAVD